MYTLGLLDYNLHASMFVDSIDLRQSVQAGGMGNDVMESICNFDIFFLQMYVFR